MPLCFIFWVIFSLPKIHFCCKHRSQHQNKSSAMAVLQSRLDQLEMVRQAQMNAQHTQSLTDITWGSQIRSYVLHVHSGTLLVSIAKFWPNFNAFFVLIRTPSLLLKKLGLERFLFLSNERVLFSKNKERTSLVPWTI